MKRALKWFSLVSAGLVLLAGALLAHTWYMKPVSIEWFYARVFLRFALDDPELLKYPIAYFSEPGGWSPNDKEVAGFRNYFLKGGFVIFDDFGEMRGFDQGDWLNTVTQMQRVLPGYQLVRLEASHPIFHAFYDISLDVISRTYRGIPAYYGIFENNDPKRRLLAILNYNNDIGEYWEFSDEGFDPIAITNEAYKLGVNYLVYALTH